MKVLIVDNNPSNRRKMNELLENQQAVKISNILVAPNRIMGAMLIEAIEFDLVIFGGILENILPDGTTDVGNSVSLASQLLQKRQQAEMVLWTDKVQIIDKFSRLFQEQKREFYPYLNWSKDITLSELEIRLMQIFQPSNHQIKVQSLLSSSTHHQEIL